MQIYFVCSTTERNMVFTSNYGAPTDIKLDS